MFRYLGIGGERRTRKTQADEGKTEVSTKVKNSRRGSVETLSEGQSRVEGSAEETIKFFADLRAAKNDGVRVQKNTALGIDTRAKLRAQLHPEPAKETDESNG
jgi:hypothetical protein